MGVFSALYEAEIIGPIISYHPTGYVEAYKCKLF
jgi:hypothetical protein